MAKIGPIQGNSLLMHSETIRGKILVVLVIVLCARQVVSEEADPFGISLVANETYEIGDSIPVRINLLAEEDVSCLGDVEVSVDGEKGVAFNVIGPNGKRLRCLSDKRCTVLFGNKWIALTNRLTRVADVDLTEVYCETYVSPIPHDFSVAGTYRITCGIEAQVRTSNSGGLISQRRISSKEHQLVVLPITSNSVEKSWRTIETGDDSDLTRILSALVKIQCAPVELSQKDLEKLESEYEKTGSAKVRTRILRLIGAKKPRDGVDFISDILLQENDPFLRAEAIGGAIGYDCEKSRKLLVEEVKSRRERSYQAAIVVLGYLGNADCIDVLNGVVKTDEVDWVRARAKESIMQIRKRMKQTTLHEKCQQAAP